MIKGIRYLQYYQQICRQSAAFKIKYSVEIGLKMSTKCQQSTKPPNILIYTGCNETSLAKFSNLKQLIGYCVNQEAYTIYHLKHDQLFKTPWRDNTSLLVISCENAPREADDTFNNFLCDKSNILSFQSSLESRFLDVTESNSKDSTVKLMYKDWKDVRLMSTSKCYKIKKHNPKTTHVEFIGSNEENDEKLIALVNVGRNKAIFCQASLDNNLLDSKLEQSEFSTLKESNASRLAIVTDLLKVLGLDCSAGEPPQLTPSYLLAATEGLTTQFLGSFARKLQDKCLKSKGIDLCFVDEANDDQKVSETFLPVVTGPRSKEFSYFNQDVYWQNLNSKTLGQVLLYTDVIPTTMTVLDGFMFTAPDNIGVIAIAGRQTSGRGRGGNSWLSPLGCAMFSLHVRIDLNSTLGRKVSFLQHIVSLAVVQSVRSLPQCEELPLKLKWPNDIYFNRSMKLGGVIANSSIMGSVIHAVIGCGFNVSNSYPSICINDIIKNWNNNHGTANPPCSTEQLIARTVTNIEKLINIFQKDGAEAFCKLYYKYWVHKGERVKVESLDFAEVTVHGLDEFGFLEVRLEDGSLVSLQPDGNSFDIMHHLIAIKRQ